MKSEKDRGLRRWRAGALLATGVAIGLMVVATPGVSHVGGTVSHLWNQHIKPRADARYARAVETFAVNGIPAVGGSVQTSMGVAPCPTGKKAVGGGAEWGGISVPTTTPSIVYSKPTGTGWTAEIEASSADSWWVQVYVVCVSGG